MDKTESKNIVVAELDVAKQKRKECNRTYYLKKKAERALKGDDEKATLKSIKKLDAKRMEKLVDDANIIQKELSEIIVRIGALNKVMRNFYNSEHESEPEPVSQPEIDFPTNEEILKQMKEIITPKELIEEITINKLPDDSLVVTEISSAKTTRKRKSTKTA